MIEAIGIDNGRHEKRMQLLQEMKAEYEERYGAAGRRHFRARRVRGSFDHARINEELKKEEEQRAQRIADDPDGKHAKMKALRDALPITAIRQDMLNALKTDQVIVISGGTVSMSISPLYFEVSISHRIFRFLPLGKRKEHTVPSIYLRGCVTFV